MRFHLHEVPRVVRFIGTETRMVVARAFGNVEWGIIVQWVQFQFGKMKFWRWTVVLDVQQCACA